MLNQKLMGSAGGDANYIEDVFSTYLYTGTGSTQTINNGINLAGKGGLVWTKDRTIANSHNLNDTVRGATKDLYSNLTSAQGTDATGLTAFGNTGYTLGANSGGGDRVNKSGDNYVSWTFRKQPKFFDVVTYTGTGSAQNVSHSLGSVPGFIVYKRTSGAANWCVLARKSNGTYESLYLNTTGATQYTADDATEAGLTSTTFNPSAIFGGESNGATDGGLYVAYLFAHDAGGFGLTGTDNVISCGSYTGTGATGNNVTLGYEPQWLMIKAAERAQDWFMFDTMRGMTTTGGNEVYLLANTAVAESSSAAFGINPTATGFGVNTAGSSFNASGEKYIYIAIRRGPMKVPTDGTKVFAPIAYTGNNTSQALTTGFSTDVAFIVRRNTDPNSGDARDRNLIDKLRGTTQDLFPNTTAAESAYFGSGQVVYNNTQVLLNFGGDGPTNKTGGDFVLEAFRRAPGFFDEICFSGTGSNTTQAHNLQKAPELWMVKSRSATTEWVFGSSLLGANEKIVMPSPNGRVTDTTVWNNTYPTASVLSLGTSSTTNSSGATFVGYLMATTAGVSKVGTYTGNGSSQTIDCGFAGGARFVMIIRATASTAQDIYVWDSARGIVSGNVPRLSLNTTAAEVTTLDTIDTASSGFVVNTDASNVNVNGAVYLYWSIA